MESLWPCWDAVQDRIGTGGLMLFLDFDGTLAPIVSRPENASLTIETRDLLRVISQKESCRVAVVSGRRLADVREKTGIEGLVYVGNHGLEIDGPGIKYAVDIDECYFKTLQQVRSQMQRVIEGYKGAFIEDKGLALSVHFRLVELDRVGSLMDRIRDAALLYSRKNLIKVRTGKMVFEIRPPVLSNKGTAVKWLMDKWQGMTANSGAIAFYCGDDATDEDAFSMLKDKGITVLVGQHDDSAARYYLDSQEDVDDVLRRLIRLRK